jgi:beta-galactosidase GanA
MAEKKFGADKYPGHINVANQYGHFSGCKAVTFSNSEKFNAFFTEEENQSLLVVDVRNDAQGNIVALYTCVMDADDMDFMKERAHFINEHMEKWKEERNRERAQGEEQEALNKKELARLAELGRKCEQNHKKDKK